MSAITTPTVCRYFDIDETGKAKSTTKWYAWGFPLDRQGDGEQEAESFLETTRDNGFDVTRVNLEVSGADVPQDTLRVYRCDNGPFGDTATYFALAVVPAESYWDARFQIEIVV